MSPIGDAARDLIRRSPGAQRVTRKTWTEGPKDAEYKVPTYSATSKTIDVIIDVSNQPAVLRNAAGIEVTVDANIYVRQEDAPNMVDGDRLPSIIDEDAHEYEVQLVEPNRIGIRRLRCRRLKE